MNRKPIFTAVKALLRERKVSEKFTLPEVKALDAAIDEALGELIVVTASKPTPEPTPTTGRKVSQRGIDLMHNFEKCVLEAYPDPGSRDGHPWTIGWGSTGEGIYKGVTWTQAEADERFARDLEHKYGKAVDRLLGSAPTTQHQFDAMVALCYNIGIGTTDTKYPGGFTRSSVLRKHKAGDYHGAAVAFGMWVKNDGKVMRGLVRRRAAEADLYDDL